MNVAVLNFWGKTKYWWLVMVLGILLIPVGLWMLYYPMVSYMTISLLFGWALLLFGIVQLLVSSDAQQHRYGWGWWLAGGIFDIFVGFLLIGNTMLSEIILPFIFAFIFLFKGISNLVSSISIVRLNRYWWMYMINAILMILISILFFYMPLMTDYIIVILCSVALIYWGLTLVIFSVDLKPCRKPDDEEL